MREWGITPTAYYLLPRIDRAVMVADLWVESFQTGVRAYERRKEAEEKAKHNKGKRR